jgi:hypothetical protein
MSKENGCFYPERLSDLPQLHRRTFSINGKTLAENARIRIEGKNKWKTSIENSSSEDSC